jgi:hypothetical protein
MDGFKDFLYDISDLILGFVVVVIIAVLFFININRFFLSAFHKNIGENMNIGSTLPPDNTGTGEIPSAETKDAQSKTDTKSAKTKNQIVNINVTIPSDSSSSDIADILYSSDIIMSKEELLEYLRKNNLENSLKAGTFSLNKSMSIKQIVDILKK